MNNDLFEREQKILSAAKAHIKEILNGAPCDKSQYSRVVEAYATILRQLRRITRISDRTTVDLNTKQQALQGRVNIDELTGIFNRRFMEEKISLEINKLSRIPGSLMSFLMMDIDFFKNYNDTYGHSQGDECLKTVAAVLAGSLPRVGDFVARYGGEEFAAVLPNTDAGGAKVVAEKILDNIRDCGIIHEKSKVAGHVTISIGATTCEVKLCQRSEDYIKRADKALYKAKAEGRDRYIFLPFDDDYDFKYD